MQDNERIVKGAHELRAHLEELLGAEAPSIDGELAHLLELNSQGKDVKTDIYKLVARHSATRQWMRNYLQSSSTAPTARLASPPSNSTPRKELTSQRNEPKVKIDNSSMLNNNDVSSPAQGSTTEGESKENSRNLIQTTDQPKKSDSSNDITIVSAELYVKIKELIERFHAEANTVGKSTGITQFNDEGTTDPGTVADVVWRQAQRNGAITDPRRRPYVEYTWRELMGLKLAGSPLSEAAQCLYSRCRDLPSLRDAALFQNETSAIRVFRSAIRGLTRALEGKVPAAIVEGHQGRLRVFWRGDDAEATWEAPEQPTDSNPVVFKSLRRLARVSLRDRAIIPEDQCELILDQLIHGLKTGAIELPAFTRGTESTDTITWFHWSIPVITLVPSNSLPLVNSTEAPIRLRPSLCDVLDQDSSLSAHIDSAFRQAVLQDYREAVSPMDGKSRGVGPVKQLSITSEATQSTFSLSTGKSPSARHSSAVVRLLQGYTTQDEADILVILCARLSAWLDGQAQPTDRSEYEAALLHIVSVST